MTNPIIPTFSTKIASYWSQNYRGCLASRDMSGAPHNEHAMCVRITHAPWACMGVAVGPTRDDRRNQDGARSLCAQIPEHTIRM